MPVPDTAPLPRGLTGGNVPWSRYCHSTGVPQGECTMGQILCHSLGVPQREMYHGTDIVSFPRGPTGGNVPWDRYCVIPQAFHREEMCHAVDIVSFPRGPTGGNVPWGDIVIPQGSHRGKCTMGPILCHSSGVPQGEMYTMGQIVSFPRGPTGANVPWGRYCVIPQGFHRGKCTMGQILCHSPGVPHGECTIGHILLNPQGSHRVEMYHGTDIVSVLHRPTCFYSSSSSK